METSAARRSIHGHEVMRRMIASGATFTAESLREAIDRWFGEGTRFHTCSAANTASMELVAFLSERRKFHAEGSGFRVDEDAICDDQTEDSKSQSSVC